MEDNTIARETAEAVIDVAKTLTNNANNVLRSLRRNDGRLDEHLANLMYLLGEFSDSIQEGLLSDSNAEDAGAEEAQADA